MDILQGIHAANDYERSLFGAVKESFRTGLNRWYSDIRPDQVNNNFFEPTAEITVEDIQAAIDQQKRRGLNYVLFRMNQPMHPPCRDSFGFEKEVMYLLLILAIQIPGGLICKENCRIIDKRSGNCHPLLFAATKFGWFMRTSACKSHLS